MSKKTNLPKSAAHVTSNNDVVYLWWSIPSKIKDCLGFTIHRIIDGKEKPLPAMVGFDAIKDTRTSPQTTDVWPIQSFNWKDLSAPIGKEVSYKIIPMVGHWKKLSPDETNAIVTEPIRRTELYGDKKNYF